MIAIKSSAALLCIVLAMPMSHKSIGAQAETDREQLARMKATYREWLSTAAKRDLLVEYEPSPQALDVPNPRFSWIVPLDGRGRKQSGYQIQVASRLELFRGTPDMWDSGLVNSSESVNVFYAGRSFGSDREYFWRVRVRDESGHLHPYSRIAQFKTGLIADADWKARWIGRGSSAEVVADLDKFDVTKLSTQIEPDLRSPLLRKEFEVRRAVQRATLFISGLGLYEARLNGRKVSTALLSPPKTDYRRRVLYDTYDVTSTLKQGVNAVGVMLGNGWFNAPKRWWGWRMQWHGSPRLLFQLEIRYVDGSTCLVVSDESWKASWSPISFNCLYDGEDYDARKEQRGWDMPGFNENAWQPVHLVAAPGGKLLSAKVQPEMMTQVVHPISIKEVAQGVFVYDMGENFSGWARLRVMGPSGTHVRLRYAEATKADGSLDRSTMMAARAEDNYVLRGSGPEIYAPRFTYRSFQYVELIGYPGTPGLDAVEGMFVHNDAAPVGSFECANELINRVHLCTVQSQRMNLQMGVLTDCAQRPERLGWGADAMVSAEEAMFNFDMPRIYAKWMADFQDEQESSGRLPELAPRPGLGEDLVWSSAYLAIPWYQYQHYGDRRILEDHYASMIRYMDYLRSQGRADIMPGRPGINPLNEPANMRTAEPGYLQRSQWGDHASLAEGYSGRSGLPLSISTAFYYYDAKLMQKIASVLHKTEDAEQFKTLASEIREAFNRKFFDPVATAYDNGSQAPQAFALSFGLVPQEQEKSVLRTFLNNITENHQNHLTTGYLGTWCLIDGLTKERRADLVWRLATNRDFPSWGDMLKGRTSVKEKWDGGSLSHVALAAPLDAWLYTTVAGIRPNEEAPAYEQIVINPYVPNDLNWARAWVETIRGRIESSWRKEKGVLRLEVTIPASTSALVYVPASDLLSVKEGNVAAVRSKFVRFIERAGGTLVFRIGSGRYVFTAPLTQGRSELHH